MNNEQWKNINNHLKNKFINSEKIQILKNFPNKNFINEMEDNKIYKLAFSCIAVDIVNSKTKLDYFNLDDWSKILSEFTFGINKIMKINGAKFIKIQGDSVYGIFQSNNKEEIDKILDCCTELNTFKVHLNKQIHKTLFDGKNGDEENEILIDYGIGAWFSFENYISKVGSGNNRDIIFMGDSVNYANALSKDASRHKNSPILFNQLMLNNFSNEYKKINNHIWDFTNHSIINNEKIFGCNWIMIKYLNWIKNNI